MSRWDRIRVWATREGKRERLADWPGRLHHVFSLRVQFSKFHTFRAGRQAVGTDGELRKTDCCALWYEASQSGRVIKHGIGEGNKVQKETWKASSSNSSGLNLLLNPNAHSYYTQTCSDRSMPRAELISYFGYRMVFFLYVGLIAVFPHKLIWFYREIKKKIIISLDCSPFFLWKVSNYFSLWVASWLFWGNEMFRVYKEFNMMKALFLLMSHFDNSN